MSCANEADLALGLRLLVDVDEADLALGAGVGAESLVVRRAVSPPSQDQLDGWLAESWAARMDAEYPCLGLLLRRLATRPPRSAWRMGGANQGGPPSLTVRAVAS
jgi:hypothetical protein